MGSNWPNYRSILSRKFYRKHLTPAQVEEVMKYGNKGKRHKTFLLITQKVCQHCGTDKNLTVDHIIPIKITGQDRDKNLKNKQLLCKPCNVAKGCKMPDDHSPSL